MVRYGLVPRFRFSLIMPIIALNLLVFVCWHMLDRSDSGFMAQNFLVSWGALLRGRVWTLLGSVFSHYTVLHIFLNMFVLWSFGSIMEQVLGRARFLSFICWRESSLRSATAWYLRFFSVRRSCLRSEPRARFRASCSCSL